MESARLCLILVTLVFVLSAIILHVIAIGTDYWLRSSNSARTNFLNIGLWVACFDNFVHPHEVPAKFYDGCHRITSDYYATIQPWLRPSWLVVCQVLSIIGLILQLIGLLLTVILLLWIFCNCICGKRNDECCQRCLIYTAPIIFIVAGMFLMMVAMAFWDNAFRLQCKDFWVGGEPNDNRLSHSWAFEVAACVVTFVAGGLLMWLAVVTGRRNYPYHVVGK